MELSSLGSVIKTAYEGVANAFTTAEKTKLASLQARRGSIGPAIPAILLRLNGSKSLTNDAIGTILWDAAVYDQFSTYTPAAGSITVPDWAKYARCTGRVQFFGSGTGFRQAGVHVNGALAPGTGWSKATATAAAALTLDLDTGIIPVVAGAKLTARAYQSSGASLVVEGNAAGTLSWFGVEFYE